MIYLTSGVVCLCIGAAYLLGIRNGYTKGYDHAIEDYEKEISKIFLLKEKIEKKIKE